ncbi:F0F1 ATP synthase subunit epsilon [Parvibaculum sedimenti]|uniref:ATP synthase epsilon chain n=1 Tax=Parvibaculum sedimenti TaxID=2608632 RepID=A0A6N6VMB3_9HYPH|nr:F0F1 ATP synthase subunit epsilon [Parvibaculum sedimenti]KAB7742189.1 F0F1 ATP synthase subunit epsilon [Parvibaculum sedimenti]
MADKLHFDLVSPERLLLSENVDMVTVPGKEGDFGVLAGHSPMMTTLRPGVINVDEAGKPQRRIFVRGGFAEVTPSGLTVLAEYTIPVEELDQARLDLEIGYAEEDVADAKSDDARLMAQEKLDHLKQMRHAL